MDDVRPYFDVEGCGLEARGDSMATKPALVLLHGGPGADHSSAMADVAQVIYGRVRADVHLGVAHRK